MASINPSWPSWLETKRKPLGPRRNNLHQSFLALQVRAQTEPVGPGRNCLHQSFLALQVGDKKRNIRARKKLLPSILPGPICWAAKVNLLSLEEMTSSNISGPSRLGTKREPVGPGRNCLHLYFLALYVGKQK
jgi:hypothetical protein